MIETLFFLSAGLFLGWSLGANDAANIFGTAVSTRMVKFKTAAIIISVFVIIGSVFSGSGAQQTLGALGKIDSLPGAFVVALAAALSIFMMTKLGLPVSTSQAVVGGIIGWNFFTGHDTDLQIVIKIVGTWIICPVLSAVIAFLLYKMVKRFINKRKIHLLSLDHYTRLGLIIAGAFGSYSLGANNIANVMGVFTDSMKLNSIKIMGILELNSTQQLFFLGAIAIAIGVCTYSKRVMMTVGNDIYKLSSMSALLVVLSHSIVLFLFASEGLKIFLESHGLPSLSLVPVSSTQAVVGAVIGIGLASGGRNINFRLVGRIGLGWIVMPVISAIISFIMMFFMQNVFLQSI